MFISQHHADTSHTSHGTVLAAAQRSIAPASYGVFNGEHAESRQNNITETSSHHSHQWKRIVGRGGGRYGEYAPVEYAFTGLRARPGESVGEAVSVGERARRCAA